MNQQQDRWHCQARPGGISRNAKRQSSLPACMGAQGLPQPWQGHRGRQPLGLMGSGREGPLEGGGGSRRAGSPGEGLAGRLARSSDRRHSRAPSQDGGFVHHPESLPHTQLRQKYPGNKSPKPGPADPGGGKGSQVSAASQYGKLGRSTQGQNQ